LSERLARIATYRITSVLAIRIEIMNSSAYEKYWQAFVDKELTFYDIQHRKYLKKGYLHFDYRIWFPEFQNALKKFIFHPNNVARHAFLPFLQVIVKTKRIKNRQQKHTRHVEFKERPISYAAHFDALLYSFYSSMLSEKYEHYVMNHSLNESVLAYRSLEKCNIDFADEVFRYIEQQEECVAIALDVKSFFPTLDHDILKRHWLRILNYNEDQPINLLPDDQFNVFRSLTKFVFVDKPQLHEVLGVTEKIIRRQKLQRFCSIEDFRNKVRSRNPRILNRNNEPFGIPQGSPMSAVLSNIYMIDYDQALIALSKKMEFCYRRYCDDIIVVCKTGDLAAVKKVLYEEITKLKLSIQPEKEEIIYFRRKDGSLRGYDSETGGKFKNLQYLGFDFNGESRYVRSSSLSRYHRRMKGGVREMIKRAYGNRGRGNRLFRYSVYDRYTHLGGQNFITYAHRASRIMNSASIRKQIARHFQQLKSTIDVKTDKHLRRLDKKGKKRIKKK
jgi:RNA-directed DNA polymerase